LHNHVVQEAAVKWKDLGVQLLDPAKVGVLDIIEKDHPQDVITCCKSMLEKWLHTKRGASWNQLLNSLKSPCVQLTYLADQIEQKLTIKKKSKNCRKISSKLQVFQLLYAGRIIHGKGS